MLGLFALSARFGLAELDSSLPNGPDLNLLALLIVNSMQDAHHEEDSEKTDLYRDEVLARLAELEALIRSEKDSSKADTGQR